MKRRRIILVLLLAGVIAGVAAFWPRGPREPVYQGKRLSQWLEQASPGNWAPYSAGRAASEGKAIDAIHAIGTNALPWLMSEFTRPQSKWRAAFNRWADDHNRWSFRFSDDYARMVRAGDGLRLLGPAVTPALPELAPYLDDRRRGDHAARAMAGAGDLALPYFLQRMTATNPAGQLASLFGLERLAKHRAVAVPPLVQALQSTNYLSRFYAALLLGEVRLRPELTIPALTAAQSDPHPKVKLRAAQSLEVIRRNSAPLIAELRRQMQDTNPAFVLTASNALHLLQSTNAPPRAP